MFRIFEYGVFCSLGSFHFDFRLFRNRIPSLNYFKHLSLQGTHDTYYFDLEWRDYSSMYATNHVLIYKGSAYSSPCFQVDSGFLEGIVRGYKAGILTQSQYASLGQCETLEGEQSVEDSVGLIH